VTAPVVERWTSPAWRAEAEAWARAQLALDGRAVNGPVVQPQVRIWSTQLTIPTTAGVVWFKENNPGQAFEAALIAELAGIASSHVVPPLAVDLDRGWLLSADHGSTLMSLSATDQHVWARVVGDFAHLQRRTTSDADRLRATGLPELPPPACVSFVDESLAELARLPESDPRQVSADLARRVDRTLPRLEEKATLLIEGPCRSAWSTTTCTTTTRSSRRRAGRSRCGSSTSATRSGPTPSRRFGSR
jgi:hypothetical protein